MLKVKNKTFQQYHFIKRQIFKQEHILTKFAHKTIIKNTL